MPRNKDIKKVLVIGSGPIIIGQAAEFDYAGTQACRSLKEEGLEVVLLNSNPATIMTDKDIADRVYIEPLTVEVVEQLILKEKPDSVLPTLGGQAGLNLAMELDEKGFLKEHNVRLIGTTAQTIKKAEDRQEFKDTMEKIGEPVAASKVVTTVEDGLAFTNTIGYPVVLRPAYTLGGSGGGIAHNEYELREILENGLRLSRVGEVLVERCIAGWKEIEYEVMRDSAGNCITVCNMENIDPVGVHTGDSIVVAPSQTLGDKEYQMLRTSALNIITELGITGGCNVQYALKPDSFEYCVIEVNPRVSRSSALASKATGYPIAKVAAKIALGYTLDEIPNAITGKTYASFEPMLDYCVVKIPRLPFDKFITAKRTLTTQMKATGEVMSICHNFEGALMKAIRSLEQHVDSLMSYDFTQLTDEELLDELAIVDDRRIWKIAEAIRRGMPQSMLHDITQIDIWFIDKLAILVGMENALKTRKLTKELLLEAKRMEFPDYIIARLTGKTEEEIKDLRADYGIKAAYKMVDTCAAEFAAATPYYYSVYGDEGTENEAIATPDKKKILVLGSGPIRIGQGIEFDFCSVHCTWAFAKEGYETIIINNNPETVSTDFDIADKLYFIEQLTVLSSVYILSRCSKDLYAHLGKGFCQLDGCLSAELNNCSVRFLNIYNIFNIFRCKRFEIQLVCNIKVSTYCLRVVVDNDSFISFFCKSPGTMYRAEVKLNTLSNTDRAGAKYQDLFLIWCGNCFILCSFITVYRIVIRSGSSKFCGTGINHLVSGFDTSLCTESFDFLFCFACKAGDNVVRELHTFCFQKKLFGKFSGLQGICKRRI